MDDGRRTFNPRPKGLYSSRYAYVSMIYVFNSFMASTVGWSGPNKVTRNTLIRAWDPCVMYRVSDRETLSNTFSVAASTRECATPLTVMT